MLFSLFKAAAVTLLLPLCTKATFSPPTAADVLFDVFFLQVGAGG